MPYLTNRKIGRPNNKKEIQDTRNNKWGRYYGNRQWKLLRDYYMALHPCCELCALEGRSVPAEHCHHRIPFSTGNTEEEKMALLLDPSNLQPLCRMHHEKIHAQLKHNHD